MHPRTITLFAFLAIFVLTAMAVLAAAVGWLPGADPKLVTWGIPALLGEIAAAVLVYFKSPTEIRVNLIFPENDATDVDLSNSGAFVVLDNSGRERQRGSIVPILGPGGYQVTLPASLDPKDSIALSFTERDSKEEWGVRPFLPYVQARTVVRAPESKGRT